MNQKEEEWEKEFDDNLYVSYSDDDTPPRLARSEKWPESKWELDPDKVVIFIRSLLHSQAEEVLEKYSRWLEKNGYMDCDWYTEEPKAVDAFLSTLTKTK